MRPSSVPGLDWTDIDINRFRGKELGFPSEITIIVSPAYGLFILGSVNNFIEHFTGSILDIEGDGFEVKVQEQITVNNETASVSPTDICLLLEFTNGDKSVLVLDIGPTIH